MSDQPETLDAILADFHSFALRAATVDHLDIHPESVLLLCDKIKAAVERERNAHTNAIHDALYKATGIPGNAAAMRSVIEELAAIHDVDDEYSCDGQNLLAFASQARAALAAPARNCDRYDVEDGVAECMQAIDAAWHEIDTIRATIGWMLAPAEGGAK